MCPCRPHDQPAEEPDDDDIKREHDIYDKLDETQMALFLSHAHSDTWDH
jgi:hypothetical protein